MVLRPIWFHVVHDGREDADPAQFAQTAQDDKQPVAEGPQVNVKVDENTIGTSNGTDKASGP